MMDEEDTKFTKLFVGGIPYHSADETLKEYFEQFDDIVEAVIIRERNSQRSKGYGFVTMATKEGAERACANKRPIIDGRRANVDLAYLGAKPKVQRDNAASPECTSAPASPSRKNASVDLKFIDTKQENHTDNTTTSPDCPSPANNSEADVAADEWVSDEQYQVYSTAQSVQSAYTRKSSHTSPPVMLPPAQVNMLKSSPVRSQQTVSSNLSLMNTMAYYQGNISPYSSLPGNATHVDPHFVDQTAVNLVTFVPQGPIASPLQNTSLNMQCVPQYGQVPAQSASPTYIYTVPVWYFDQGRVSCGQVSLEPVSTYSQAPMISAGVDGTSGGYPGCKMYPITSYY